MGDLPLLWCLQKPEVEETKTSRRRQPKDTPKGVLLPVHCVFREEAAFRTVHRHHHHSSGRELFPGQQGQREDRADDAHRRTRLKVVVPTFATGLYYSCDYGPALGPSEGVDGTSFDARSPKRLNCGGRSFASLLRWTILIA
nr:uncharacterized protein LOC106690548 isoform X1 [Halyomorpha halys]